VYPRPQAPHMCADQPMLPGPTELHRSAMWADAHRTVVTSHPSRLDDHQAAPPTTLAS